MRWPAKTMASFPCNHELVKLGLKRQKHEKVHLLTDLKNETSEKVDNSNRHGQEHSFSKTILLHYKPWMKSLLEQ